MLMGVHPSCRHETCLPQDERVFRASLLSLQHTMHVSVNAPESGLTGFPCKLTQLTAYHACQCKRAQIRTNGFSMQACLAYSIPLMSV